MHLNSEKAGCRSDAPKDHFRLDVHATVRLSPGEINLPSSDLLSYIGVRYSHEEAGK
jgi:hypothetical protein